MFFENKLKEFYNENNILKIINGSKERRKTTIRINTLKTDKLTITNELNKLGINYESIEYNDDALILHNDAEKLRQIHIYKNGEIYFQSLSSQLPPLLLSPDKNTDILDMCAAPGGKTSHIAAITQNKCNITACEINKIRAQRLEFNLDKLGVRNANVMVTDARNLEEYFSFDKILLDAPCSGSGTFNLSDIKTYEGFSDALINKCVSIQKKLLEKAINLLKKDGEILYSTCSILPVENEEIIKHILNKFDCEIVEPDSTITNNLPKLPCSLKNAICVCPTDEYEGFFMAKIKKRTD